MDKPIFILVVEDDPGHAEAVRRAFAKTDIKADLEIAGTIKAYHEAVEKKPPDIALFDLNLPDGRALDVLASSADTEMFPVLIMTSHGDEHVVVEAMRAGALDYIVKSPDSFQSIPRAVARALREWRLIMERRQATTALEESETRIRAIYNHLPNPTLVWQRQGENFVLTFFNSAASAMTGENISNFTGRSLSEPLPGFPSLTADVTRCFSERTIIRSEMEYTPADARPSRLLVATYGFVPPDMVLLYAEDVTEQRQTEEQLRIAQRMEAVGRLAGGIAHDFNNMLSVILNHAEFALEGLHEGRPLDRDLLAIQRAAARSAALTQRLLAFSRKQILQPKVINLNKAIADMLDMLRRLLGEDVELLTEPAPTLSAVKVDPGQFEQILMNLSINARDAMPKGGKLTLRTRKVAPDKEGELGVEIKGPHVELSVIDTGCGMDEDTLPKIFEPFFTTKEVGKGTGLGLATVYGIVKQSGGDICVESAPGKGTSFKIYLPEETAEAMEQETSSSPYPSAPPSSTGNETVLLAEDEGAVRNLAEQILLKAGYNVLSARNGEDALRIFDTSSEKIHLLLSDVVMPHMGGKELAERLAERNPHLRVVFMSGYTDEAVLRHGIADIGIRFNLIRKPFRPSALTRLIREVLDRPELTA